MSEFATNKTAVVLWSILFALALGAGNSPSEPTPVIVINLSDAAINSLRDHPRRNVPAEVRIGNVSYSGARVHLKGSGSFQPIDRKPSFTVTFPQKSPFSTSKIYLNNSAEDGTYVQEELGSEIFAAIGITTPRVSHARVQVNGHAKGLYVLKESFSGIVYDKNSFAKPELTSLFEAAKEPNLETRWQKLNALLDIDEFISFAAMEVLICHWDGYTLAQNNFRVCRDSVTQRFIFLPSGMDQIFGNPRFPLNPDMTGTLARALLEVPEGKARFTGKLAEVASKLDARKTSERAHEILVSLRSSVSSAEFADMRDNLEELCSRIEARQKFAQSQFQILASTR